MSLDPPAPAGGDADLRLVVREWQRRTQAEYGSAAVAQQVTLWLIQVGAPPDLIRDGLQVVRDELAHSELSAEVAGAAADRVVRPVIDPAVLTLPAPNGPLLAVASAVVRYFCIGETVAVPLFRMLRSKATVPAARRVLDTVLGDEARHRQFGWDSLDWLLSAHGGAVAPAIAGALPGLVEQVQRAYGDAGGRAPKALPSAVEAWGLAPPSEYAAVLATALADDVFPRLAARFGPWIPP